MVVMNGKTISLEEGIRVVVSVWKAKLKLKMAADVYGKGSSPKKMCLKK